MQSRILKKKTLFQHQGQDRFEVRDTIIQKLSEIGSYKGRNDNHVMRIAVCSRSGDVIEPLLQPQW